MEKPKVLVFSNAHFQNFRYSNGSPMIPRQADDQTRFPNEIFYTCSSAGYQWDVSNGSMRRIKPAVGSVMGWMSSRSLLTAALFNFPHGLSISDGNLQHVLPSFSQLDVCAGTWTSVQPLSILFQNAVACSKLVFFGFLLTDMHETAVAYWTRCKGHSAVIPVSTPSLRALHSASLAFWSLQNCSGSCLQLLRIRLPMSHWQVNSWCRCGETLHGLQKAE